MNLNKLKINSYGVEDFFWPVSISEEIDIRNNIIKGLHGIVSKYLELDPDGARLLKIAFTSLIVEAMAIIRYHLLKSRSRDPIHLHSILGPGRLVTAVFKETNPSQAPIIQKLISGLPRSSKWEWIPKKLRRKLRYYQLNPVWVKKQNPNNNLKATATCILSPLIIEHSKSVADRIEYIPIEEWFEPLFISSSRDLISRSFTPSVSDEISEIINASLPERSECVPDYLVMYLVYWLEQLAGVASLRLNSFLEHKEKLPDTLWTGTSNVWTRILRHAVRLKGGSVIGHDHGSDGGMIVTLQKTINEFDSCDTFITYSKSQAEIYRQWARPDLLLQDSSPVISYVNTLPSADNRHLSAKLVFKKDKRGSISFSSLKVLYPSSFYRGDVKHHFTYTMPDLVMVDWEARLFEHLTKLKHKILLKPHPGSVYSPPKAYNELYNLEVSFSLFENVVNQADIIIFTSPFSTTFSYGLKSNIPILFIDFNYVEWEENAYNALKKRCSIISGWFDNSNRACIHWDMLGDAMKMAFRLSDDTFAKNYL